MARSHEDSGGGSDQFIVKGGDNSVEEFGREADRNDFEEAARALHNFLDARAERNWAAACSYLTESVKDSIGSLGAGSEGRADCVEGMLALSGKVPVSTLREATVASEQGFLIYRCLPRGTIYAIDGAGAWYLEGRLLRRHSPQLKVDHASGLARPIHEMRAPSSVRSRYCPHFESR